MTEPKKICVAIASRGRPSALVGAAQLRRRLNYNPSTGIFTWLPRPGNDHQTNAWNAKWAGKRAGWDTVKGYRSISIEKIHYYEHRLAWLYMTGEWPSEYIDHENCDGHDNRWSNIRGASHSQNMANRIGNRNSRSGIKGIMPSANGDRWVAQIQHSGRNRYLGTFDSVEEASAAYRAAAAETFGQFARVG